MKLYEGLNYLDMEGQIKPTITISLMDAPVVQEVIDLLSAQEVPVDPLVEVALLQEAVVVEINNP